MTARTLSRGWGLSSALFFAALALAASALLYSNWGSFIQWCLEMQIALHRYLVLYLLQLNDGQYRGGVWLISGAFIYGVLHAIGPGHGKFVVATWSSTAERSIAAARLVPFFGSLMQGVSAIAFVFILAVGFNLAAGDLSQSRWYVEKISAVLIGGFGGWIIWRALRGLKRNHDHAHDCGCGHHHQAQAVEGGWKDALGVILAIGARPCSGAIMILLFANALGIVSWGIAAVMGMALGTALSIMGLSLAVRHIRDSVTSGWHIASPERLRLLGIGVRVLGGALLVLFALVLFLTVIPVSANGDYIAAGC
ncbi:nickel/cobalt transporter [Enterobacteriaceae bacterium 4M9]|nr:nickel/cobalt transporter [Enterobacteriaceae bacterium 4M9]